MESTTVSQKPAISDVAVSLVLQLAKKGLNEILLTCENIAAIATRFLIFKNSLIKLREQSLLTTAVKAKKYADYKKLIGLSKNKVGVDATIKKVLDIYGNLTQLNPQDLTEKRNVRLTTLFTNAEVIQENLLGAKEVLSNLHAEIITLVLP